MTAPQSKITGHIIFRFTQHGDGICDRCCGDILHGDWAGRVKPGLHTLPWAAGTLLCSACADRLEDKIADSMMRASQEEAGFDPDAPHRPKFDGTINCTLCGRVAAARVHEVES